MGIHGSSFHDYYNVPKYLPREPLGLTAKEEKLMVEALPRPIYENEFGVFDTANYPPPPPESFYSVREQGLSSPRLLRFAMNYIPSDNSIYKNIGLPIAAIWQPFAELLEDDDQVCTSNEPPFRCTNCMAYVNSFFQFLKGRDKCICNICGTIQKCPSTYADFKENKPELNAGTYEFKAPKEYMDKPAQVPLFLFCIDISTTSAQLGILNQVILSVQTVLDCIPGPAMIGVITFDDKIQIYKVNDFGELSEVIITDIDEPFFSEPVSSSCFDVWENRKELEFLLTGLLQLKPNREFRKSLSIGALLQGLKDSMLKSRGGRVIIFSSKIGEIGKHALTQSADPRPTHGFLNKSHLAQENYSILAEECSQEDICIDIFICTNAIVKIPDLSVLCTVTGGDLYYFPGFNIDLDGERLYYKIARILTRPQCTQVLMRARCSNGLSVDFYIGKCKNKSNLEIQVPCLDSDKSFVVVLKYSDKLEEDSEAFLQCAMLYTSGNGDRIFRVFNGRMYVTKNVDMIYKYADIDAVANVMVKVSACNMFVYSLKKVREDWMNDIACMLKEYKKITGSLDMSRYSPPGPLKLLPLYCNSAFKLNAFTLSDVSLDSRLYSVHALLTISVLQLRLLLYPQVFSLCDFDFPESYDSEIQKAIARTLPSSLKNLKSEGIYIINNGEIIVIYLGSQANEEFLFHIWGTRNIDELFACPDMRQIKDLGSEESQKVWNLLEDLKKRTPNCPPAIYFHFEGRTQGNYMITKLMVEDSTSKEMSYETFIIDCVKLCNRS